MFALIERSSGPDVSPIGKCSHVWLLGGLCVWTMVGCARKSSLTDLGYSWSLTPNSGCWPSMPLLPSDLQPEPDSGRKNPPRQHDTLRWMLMLDNHSRAGVVGEEDAGAGGAGVH